jgi:hypothetical protein
VLVVVNTRDNRRPLCHARERFGLTRLRRGGFPGSTSSLRGTMRTADDEEKGGGEDSFHGGSFSANGGDT